MRKSNEEKIEYYGGIDFKGKRFALPYTPQLSSDNEGIEFTARIGNEPFCAPIRVHCCDALTTHYPYSGLDGEERILRVSIDFVSRERYEAYKLAHETYPLLIEQHRLEGRSLSDIEAMPLAELRSLREGLR